MGFGGRGRGGSTSRQESNEGSKGKKESKPSEGKSSEDEIRKLVAKFLKELAGNTNPKKAPRLLNKISEETVRALGFMSKLKYVTVQQVRSSRRTRRHRARAAAPPAPRALPARRAGARGISLDHAPPEVRHSERLHQLLAVGMLFLTIW